MKNRMLRCVAWAATGLMVTLAIGTLTGTPIEQTAHGVQRDAGMHFVRIGELIAAALTGPRIAAAGQPVHEVQVVASRFAFEPATIQVIAGEPVRLIVRSKDGTHGFAIPKLKIDLHIPDSGDPVTAEFTAPVAGEYEIACSEFCGRGHAQMKAALVSTSATSTNR